MTLFGKNSVFGTVKQVMTRGLATAAVLGATFSVSAGETFVINQHGEVNISEYSATELATTGSVQMVVTTMDAYGEAADSFVLTQTLNSEFDVVQENPVEYTSSEEMAESSSEAGIFGQGNDPDPIVDPDGKRALSNDAITITLPRSTKGPVVLIVDGKVMVVPTN